MTNRYTQIEQFALDKLKNELPKIYKYHSFYHTKDMLGLVDEYVLPYSLPFGEIELLRIAILFHDMGFIVDWKDHEAKGCSMAENALNNHEFSLEDIQKVKELIIATRMPQEPNNDLERIICDIDLDYLGRDDYFVRSELLYEEWLSLDIVQNRAEWKERELDFLKNHQFHSIIGRKYRQPQLDKNIALIELS